MNHQLSAVDRYARLNLRTNVETASPHRIITLLLDGALTRLRAARQAMQQGETAAKGAGISWTISIVDGLRASLDVERGGELAANLDRLYEYMGRTLIEANLLDDVGKLDEVEALLGEIRAGWAGIEGQIDDVRADARNEVGPSAVGIG